MGVEARKRIDDSYFGYNAVWFDRSNNQIIKIGFIPATYERPLNDNVVFMYNGGWKVIVYVDYRSNPTYANLKFKVVVLSTSTNEI